ncbi:MAG: alginate O-acetyltransferase complex protein AlgI [Verrucomicrobiota bacterium]|jgi:alginate O-acetyltransferase complex protein AlgI
MSFVEFRFLWFFLIVFAVYWAMRDNTKRKVWLLICSYLFYAAWNWKFTFLLLGSTTIDYTVGKMMAREENPKKRRAWLIASLCANLGVLGFFKYFNFFIDSAAAFSAWLGLPVGVNSLNIILPVGISFYTFQSMSYTIDVYRGRQAPVSSFLDLALFISFFTHLVAGPIMPAIFFLPQLSSVRKFSDVDVRGALVLFLTGFIKKACIADGVAPIADRYFANPAGFTAASAWVGVLFYAIQIYCDFSGYTDMARASARLLGYELVLNFRFPYFAQNIADFWHRWHISLSSWLREYLYIPLGGNRGPRWFVYRNIMITMLLGGLWHGAAWTFVIWGGLHGIALVFHREWTRLTNGLDRVQKFMRWLAGPITIYWVCVAWIFFRAPDLRRAAVALQQFVFFHSAGTKDIGAWMLLIVVALAFAHWLNHKGWFSEMTRRWPTPVFAVAYGCTAAVVLLFVPTHYTPFIYFQF